MSRTFNYLVKVPIGPAVQSMYDPTTVATADILARRAQKDQTFAHIPGDIPVRKALRWWEALQTNLKDLLETRHAPYARHCLAHNSKVGRQGGRLTGEMFESLLEQYYDVPEFGISSIMDTGLQLLLQEIETLLLITEPPCVYDVGRGAVNTFSGIPVCGRKGEFHAETLGPGLPGHLLPAIPGTRYMRQKPRVIFKDATWNVRQVERPLTATRLWLRTHLPQFFAAWSNPALYVNPMATRAIATRCASAAFDYRAMDMHVTLETVTRYVFPIWERLLGSQAIMLEALVTEMFDQPLYMGNELWTGRHTLFSGVSITNDAETLISVIVSLGLLHHLGIPIQHAIILALGDDLTISVRRQYAERLQEDVLFPLLCDVEQTGLVFSRDPSKTGICPPEELTFCRRIYYPAAPVDGNQIMQGAYPSPLVFGQIFCPEYPSQKLSTEIASRLQRLDNLQWSPDHKFVAYLLRGLFPSTPPADLEAPVDWWTRLYGERWNPDSSPTFHFLYPYK